MLQEEPESARFWVWLEPVIGACVEVHRHLGPGMMEATYERCVCMELALRGIRFERRLPIPMVYKGVPLDSAYRADLVVEGRVLVVLRAVDRLLPIDEAELRTCLRLTGLELGLLVNFRVTALKYGVRRLIRKADRLQPQEV